MDGEQFDDLLRSLRKPRTRRHVARALAGLALGGMFGSLLSDGAESRKRRGRRKKDKGKTNRCDPCKKSVRNGNCEEFERDETTCNNTGKCYQGTCVARPTCVGAFGTCTGVSPCCSQSCAPIANQCFYSGIGQPCFTTKDCHPDQNLSCVAFKCR